MICMAFGQVTLGPWRKNALEEEEEEWEEEGEVERRVTPTNSTRY